MGFKNGHFYQFNGKMKLGYCLINYSGIIKRKFVIRDKLIKVNWRNDNNNYSIPTLVS